LPPAVKEIGVSDLLVVPYEGDDDFSVASIAVR